MNNKFNRLTNNNSLFIFKREKCITDVSVQTEQEPSPLAVSTIHKVMIKINFLLIYNYRLAGKKCNDGVFLLSKVINIMIIHVWYTVYGIQNAMT